jgi:tetratricopeptide (TPR) repeat protein/tRNA A-37 threonylcarbamoyl transferase component Bud32
MPDNFTTVERPLSPELALRMNEVCDRFEAAWKAVAQGAPEPRIEEYLAEVPGVQPALLLPHLLLLEVDYRRLRGEQPTTSDYESRFPDLSDRFLAEVFPEPRAGKPIPSAAAPAKPDREAGAPKPAGNGKAEPPPGEDTVLVPSFNPQLRSHRYVLRQFHARGGIGEVWLAEDAEIGRRVALKRLRKKREDHEQRFLVEAQITGQLEHPGIVPVHDLGVDDDGRPFYVMTFIHGQTLKEVVADYHAGKSPSGEPLEVQGTRLLENFVKVCEAVAYAHHRGVVHRDVKPDNVMLGPFGETLVLDWGMAKVRSQTEAAADTARVQLTYSSGSRETQAGIVMGSPVYMAPEMAEGRPSEADERTDVYLLGATLYHILTGQPPREGSSYDEILELARTVPPPPPRRRKADVPRALEAICLKAMAHHPRDRYASARELGQDVQRYLAGAPVTAYPEPVLARAWRWCKRHRRAVGKSVAAVVVLTLALVGAALLREAWNRESLAQRHADELQRCADARRDLAEFHRLAEERQFYAVSTTPAAETALYYDSRRGQAAGEKAIALAERLSKEMEQLPLRDEHATLDRELHNLLLLMAQTQSQQAHDPRAAVEILDRLKRAASLLGPSRSYYRLRARCCHTLGNRQQAAEEEQRAAAAQPTALDHFLEAEEYRIRSGSPAEASGDALAWQPNAELLRQAIVRYQQALQLEPSNFWCHLQLGRCYLSLGQGSEAVEALGACVALKPKAPWGYSARGLTLGLIRPARFAEGEADLRQALAFDPRFAPALLHRGILAWLQRKDTRALDDFTSVLQLPADARLIEAAYYRGQLHLERQEFLEALKDFDLVVKETPGFRPVYLSRAQVHFLRGDDTRGLADLTTFLDRGSAKPFDPRDARLFALRGRLLHQLVPHWGLPTSEVKAKLELTLNELKTARQLGHRSAELFDDLGSVAQRLGKWGEARAAYEEALKTAPRDLAVKVRTKRGWIYAGLRAEHASARADFAEAVRLDPTHADAHAGLGYLQALQKSPSEAQRAAAQALWHGSNNYPVLHNVACIYAELSRSDPGQAKQHQDMAVALLQRAVELCRRGGGGARENDNIRGDTSFDVLRGRPDFENLLRGKEP